MNNEHLKMRFSQAKREIERIDYDEYYMSFSLEEINILIKMLETTHNSDYAVPPSATPKLPSLDNFTEYMLFDRNGPKRCTEDHIQAYEIIKKLGNFA